MLRTAAPEVAPTLLGWRLTSDTSAGRVSIRLTEVEAYAGQADPASHAFRGPTPRNEVMFGPPGRLYVYLSYGMHWCANVVVGADGVASAVLLRAGRVVEGVGLARARRTAGTADHSLARGPACLTRTLGIGREHDGAYLFGADGPLTLTYDERPPAVSSGPRVGISRAAGVPWRFWVTGDETVSAYKRSPRAS
jgi:DNA-3-methyladenine glycosylase